MPGEKVYLSGHKMLLKQHRKLILQQHWRRFCIEVHGKRNEFSVLRVNQRPSYLGDD